MNELVLTHRQETIGNVDRNIRAQLTKATTANDLDTMECAATKKNDLLMRLYCSDGL